MQLTDLEVRELIKKYSLSNDELYRVDDKKLVISARGIRKIITVENLNVSKRIFFDPFGTIAVIARVEFGGPFGQTFKYYESVGEARTGLNTNFKYPVAVAEARANGRAVLMMMGLYEKGIISDAELDMETESDALREKRKKQADVGMTSLMDKIGIKPTEDGNKATQQERDITQGPVEGGVAQKQSKGSRRK